MDAPLALPSGSSGPAGSTYARPSPVLAKALGVPSVPIPLDAQGVREAVDEQGEVQADLLVDSWARVLATDREARVRDGPVLARWACAVADQKGAAGDAEAAEHYVRLGLQFSPENLSLHSRLGLALMEQRQLAQALVEFKQVMDDPRTGFGPVLWLAAGRTAMQLRLYGEAVRILEQYAAYLPGDDAFWDLLGECRRRAGLGPPRPKARPQPAAAAETWQPVKDEWEKVD
jgi:predicted Zn-dependent protease